MILVDTYERIRRYFERLGFVNVVTYSFVAQDDLRWTAKVRAEIDGHAHFFKAGGAFRNDMTIYTWNDIEAEFANSNLNIGAEIAPEKSATVEHKIEIESINGMKIEKFVRRPFDVNAVQVTPQNAAEIAAWCGGKVGQSDYKLAGFDGVKLDTVLVPGNGPNEGRDVQARIGSWVVELDGKFRVLRKKQFHEMFAKKDEVLVTDQATRILHLQPGDLVQDTDENDGIWQGEVVYIDQILVKFPFKGNVLCEKNELVKIDAYSEQTEKKWLLAAEADNGVPYDEALEKINTLRAAAEAAIGDGLTVPPPLLEGGPSGVGCFSPAQGKLDDVTEVNGMKINSRVRVTFELNMFYGEVGDVHAIDPDGKVLHVLMDNHKVYGPVPCQPDELELDPSNFEVNDLVKEVAGNGETGLVTVVGCDPEGESDRYVEVLYGNTTYAHYLPHQIVRVGHKYDLPEPKDGRDVNWGDHEVGDMVETLIDRQCVPEYAAPAGTTAKVVELTNSDLGGGVAVEFANGVIGHYFGDHLKKI